MILFNLLDKVITYVRILFNPVCPIFTPFELALFDKIKEMLSDVYKLIFNKQLSEVNYAQRAPRYEYIHFYKYGVLCSRQNYSTAFNEAEDENVLLRFKIVIDNKNHIRAELWQVKGALFGIEYDQGVIDYKYCTNLVLSRIGGGSSRHEHTPVPTLKS